MSKCHCKLDRLDITYATGLHHMSSWVPDRLRECIRHVLTAEWSPTTVAKILDPALLHQGVISLDFSWKCGNGFILTINVSDGGSVTIGQADMYRNISIPTDFSGLVQDDAMLVHGITMGAFDLDANATLDRIKPYVIAQRELDDAARRKPAETNGKGRVAVETSSRVDLLSSVEF